jgi:hypothetical protein
MLWANFWKVCLKYPYNCLTCIEKKIRTVKSEMEIRFNVGEGGTGKSQGDIGGEIAQTLYAHMNKQKKEKVQCTQSVGEGTDSRAMRLWTGYFPSP